MESSKTRTIVLMRGNEGKEVAQLKKALRAALGDGAARFPGWQRATPSTPTPRLLCVPGNRASGWLPTALPARAV